MKLSAIPSVLGYGWRTFKLFAGVNKGLFALLVSVIFIGSFTHLANSAAFANLIGNIEQAVKVGDFSEGLIWALVLVLGVEILSLFIRVSNSYLSRIFRFAYDEKAEFIMARKSSEIDIASYEDPEVRNLFQVVQENDYRMFAFGSGQLYSAQNFVRLLATSGTLFFMNPYVLVFVFIGVLPELFTQLKHGRRVWGIYAGKAEVRRRWAALGQHFYSVNSLSEIKIFQTAERILGWIKNLFLEFQDEQRKAEKSRMVKTSISSSVSMLFLFTSSVYFVWSAVRGEISTSALIFSLSLINQFRGTLSDFFSGLAGDYEHHLFVKDIFKFLDLEPRIRLPKPGLILGEATPEIVFENVSFRYQNQQRLALKNITLKVMPGEKIALVGENGAGKTTFVKLLCRFYDAEKGRVLLDGTSIKEVNLESWHSKLGVLFQEYPNYDLPVWEQISLGSSAVVDREKIKEGAKSAGAADFIEKWEKGYDQMVGKQYADGMEPSVGQRQKLALARVFYRDPQVWILDEPTSSIDPEAEEKIFEKLEQLPKDRTVFLISHRFSTVRHADRILVFKDGEVVEQGTHKELIKLKGLYEHLFSLQAKGYK
jgi:ATP-binding cassette subfamily B protein